MGLTSSKPHTSSSSLSNNILDYTTVTRVALILSFWIRKEKCKTNVFIPKEIISLISKYDNSYFIASINNTSNNTSNTNNLFTFNLNILKKNPIKAIMFGLDFAGKTTIKYKLNIAVTTIPNIGFSIEDFKYKNMEITIFDVGGQEKMRPLMRHYYQNTKAIIFVIDSSDKERMGSNGKHSYESSVYEEFHYVLNEKLLKHCNLLIFANKQDLKNAMSVKEIYSILELEKIKDRKWCIQGSVATKDDGIIEGFDWLFQFS